MRAKKVNIQKRRNANGIIGVLLYLHLYIYLYTYRKRERVECNIRYIFCCALFVVFVLLLYLHNTNNNKKKTQLILFTLDTLRCRTFSCRVCVQPMQSRSKIKFQSDDLLCMWFHFYCVQTLLSSRFRL